MGDLDLNGLRRVWQNIRGQCAGNPNLLVNGGFEVWQRGTSFGTVAAGNYTADRWTNGSGCALFQKTANGAKQTGASVAGALLMEQTIEHANGTFDFTLSMCIKSSGPFSLILGTGDLVFESEDSSFPACEDFTTVHVSFSNISITSGKIAVYVRSNLTTAKSLTIECKWVKLEHGLVATPWQSKGYGAELADCLRYFERIGTAKSPFIGSLCKVDGTKLLPVTVSFYPKRAAPSIRFSAASQYRALMYNNNGTAFGAVNIESFTRIESAIPNCAAFFAYAPNLGSSAVYAIIQRQDTSTSAWIDIDAEL